MGTGELMDLDGSCVCEKLFRPGTPAVRVYQVSEEWPYGPVQSWGRGSLMDLWTGTSDAVSSGHSREACVTDY